MILGTFPIKLFLFCFLNIYFRLFYLLTVWIQLSTIITPSRKMIYGFLRNTHLSVDTMSLTSEKDTLITSLQDGNNDSACPGTCNKVISNFPVLSKRTLCLLFWVKQGISLHSPHPYIIISLVNVSLDSEWFSVCARDTQLLFALFSNVSVSISLTPSTTINRWYLNWPLK